MLYTPNSNVNVETPLNDIDAIVFIAMGKLSQDFVTDNAIATVREIGMWNGDIFVITDHERCFDDSRQLHSAKIIQIPSVDSILEIKALKTRVLTLLPDTVNNVLYMDVDILVNKRLDIFLNDFHYLLEQYLHGRSSDSKPDFGMFLDAGGHFFGFCAGCEKWHTGVIYMTRGGGEQCLREWERVLLSGKYDTDQQSIDSAYNNGFCPNTIVLPSKHLLFAKDYFAMFLTPARSFVHLTSINKKSSDSNGFYKYYIVPKIRSDIQSQNRDKNLFKVTSEMKEKKNTCIA
jgi:hypothetical protein